jgi:hypothetical protein
MGVVAQPAEQVDRGQPALADADGGAQQVRPVLLQQPVDRGRPGQRVDVPVAHARLRPVEDQVLPVADRGRCSSGTKVTVGNPSRQGLRDWPFQNYRRGRAGVGVVAGKAASITLAALLWPLLPAAGAVAGQAVVRALFSKWTRWRYSWRRSCRHP